MWKLWVHSLTQATKEETHIWSGVAGRGSFNKCLLSICYVPGDFPKSQIYISEQGRPNGTSLVIQRLRVSASGAGDAASIPGWGTRIPHALRWQKKKKKPSALRARAQAG